MPGRRIVAKRVSTLEARETWWAAPRMAPTHSRVCIGTTLRPAPGFQSRRRLVRDARFRNGAHELRQSFGRLGCSQMLAKGGVGRESKRSHVDVRHTARAKRSKSLHRVETATSPLAAIGQPLRQSVKRALASWRNTQKARNFLREPGLTTEGSVCIGEAIKRTMFAISIRAR
jgi:hypothetical protein